MTQKAPQKPIKTRRLSPWRVMLAVTIVASTIALGYFGWRETRLDPMVRSNKPWFAPYVDVTATPQFAFEQLGTANRKDAVLSFVVASQKDPCTPSWGAAYSLDEASDALDLDRRIARLKQQGGSVAISFGGLTNDELASVCENDTKLANAYKSVVDRYDVSTVDLDLENDNLQDPYINTRRANAIAKLQTERRAAHRPFAVWLTLPVTSDGLDKHGTDAVAQLLKASVDIAGVNVMTMDYSGTELAGKNITDVSISSLKRTQHQLGILYDQAGTYLNDVSLWRKIGVTPMIGQSDIKNEVFRISDAKRLNAFARDNGVGRVSMWSANRDIECGTNYVDPSIVSNSCSGVRQNKFAFMDVLSDGFEGNIAGTADNVTVAQAKPSEKSLNDDPATSPYQIWSDSGVYLAGTKVVWHHNVYQAKWWTKGDTPDNPVLQSWQTPWDLIGPVLPGEKPVKQAALPAGTYPEWSGDATYEAEQRVLFKGIAYQAKWWNRGESPAAASSSADASPWTPLSQAEINKILKDLK
ncbi:glycosyl hydrolase family 18 [Candidatus Saccharibacteria bacterium]|nr:glycosyl hydrolase family 18 [Candidatus Saccharibacteria bacterium]